MTAHNFPGATMANKAPQATGGQKSKSATETDRTCRVCGVKLSSYNPGPNCWQHTIGHPWQGPTAKPRC